MMRRMLKLAALGALLTHADFAVGAPSSPSACQRLRNVVATRDQHPVSEYYCAGFLRLQDYAVIQLHQKVDPTAVPPDWVGSDLRGYFAVKRGGFCVREYDFANDRLGAVIAGNCNRGLPKHW